VTEPIRVLQVLGRSAGGIARHVAQITAALDAEDLFAVDVAAPDGLPVALPKHRTVVDIPEGPRGHRRAVQELERRIAGAGYEVVHAHGLRAGMDAGRAARTAGAYRVLTVHNLVRPEVVGRIRASLYRVAEPLAVALTDRTFAVSADVAESMARRAPRAAGRIEVLHLGVGDAPPVTRRADDVRSSLDVPEGGRLIVTASRLAPQKALDVLLAALSLLPPRVVLAVLGEGELEEELRRRAKSLGVDGRVRWLGFRSDLPDHIAAADVFCLSSVWEGVPLAAQEAILLGTPVVATGVGGMAELIADRRSGRLVPPGDPEALAGALRQTLEDPAAAREWARASLEHVKRSFSTRAMLERLKAAYLEGVHAS
jgi:glycosyltransferase involved in cell wall biosynthesis